MVRGTTVARTSTSLTKSRKSTQTVLATHQFTDGIESRCVNDGSEDSLKVVIDSTTYEDWSNSEAYICTRTSSTTIGTCTLVPGKPAMHLLSLKPLTSSCGSYANRRNEIGTVYTCADISGFLVCSNSGASAAAQQGVACCACAIFARRSHRFHA